MKRRPKLEVGDVVRLSHRGRAALRYKMHMGFGKAMIVAKTSIDSSDGKSRIRVLVRGKNNKMHMISLRRSSLWKTDRRASISMAKGSLALPKSSKLRKRKLDIGADTTTTSAPRAIEVKCLSCGKNADLGAPCWWCGAQN